ncbi:MULTISPECIES: ROK family transcriptional regulator [unclassified Streptomyces]|uniref:ROK family transcriptional regulator n=1 Tax=unclassified Streptomyces TaxID=2593676 RepID=UPI00225BC3A5|nr:MULTISPECIES: ROK family transcriptional regulator [unclassified Streptomyces]MCX5143581.1 ROK family protein [Streptomyces sp. NBC_00338]WRZ68017.1 ROK family protein [Streptomyces sp. NBC_01257]
MTIESTSPGAKAGTESVRRNNLGLVLRAVLEEGEVTRARAAARVGLTRAAVSSLVEELLALDLLTESGKTFSGSAGRPGTVLKVSETGPAGLGVEINIDYVSVCAVGLGGTDRVRVTEHIDNRNTPPAEVLAHAARLTNRVITSTGEQGLRAVGVELALPGLVSGGMVRQAPNLGWYRVAAEGIFGQALSTLRPAGRALAVSSDNEANLAALAELWFGGLDGADGGGARGFLYLTGEIGVGGALVLQGELLRGAHGFAGEVGHVVVDPQGPLCGCGARGCLEQYAGQAALLRAAGIDPAAGVRGLGELEKRARAGDPGTLEVLRAAGDRMGLVLAGAVNLFDLDTVVLGGIYRDLMPWLAGAAEAQLADRVVSGRWRTDGSGLRASSLSGDAARGAAARVVRGVLADPAAYAAR